MNYLQYVCELESVEHDTLLASLYSDRHGCVEDQLRYATSLFTAATTNDVVDDTVSSALGDKHMRLVTGEVNRLVADVLNMTPPPPVNGDTPSAVATDQTPRTCVRAYISFFSILQHLCRRAVRPCTKTRVRRLRPRPRRQSTCRGRRLPTIYPSARRPPPQIYCCTANRAHS
jgi:hypothetical protein